MGRDARIVYGARCTWWDSIDRVGKLESGIPCCPECRGVLMEVSDLDTWSANVEEYAREADDPGYPAFMRWLRGRCFPDVDRARARYDVEPARRVRELATTLVRKLDVALPKIDGMIAFTSLRAGARSYDGPTLHEEVEELRGLLGLPKPAAEAHEFYPEGYCETCKGSGGVPGGDGIRSHVHRMNPDMPRSAWKDVCRDCRGTGGRGLPVPAVDYVKGKPVLATEVDD